MIDIAILEKLNAPVREMRLENLREVLKATEFPPMVPQYINNHIHTTYSFSPYSPTAAVYAARMEGLCTAGIIDHDSIAGAQEFLAAAELVGMPVTVGMECRVSMDGTAMQGRRTNNPDQVGVSYMTIQSVPHDKIEQLPIDTEPFRPRQSTDEMKRIVYDPSDGSANVDAVNDMLLASTGGTIHCNIGDGITTSSVTSLVEQIPTASNVRVRIVRSENGYDVERVFVDDDDNEIASESYPIW